MPDLMLGLGCLGLLLELLIAAGTLLPGAPLIPQWPQFVLFPFIFVVHISSVARVRSVGGHPEDLLEGLPGAAKIAFGALCVLAAVGFLSSISGLAGQPSIAHGRYYLDHHGSMIAVPKAGYRHALVLQTRIFTLIPAVFFGLGVLTHFPRTQH